MRIPIVKSLHIEDFSGTGINAADYFNKNAIIGEYDDGRIYATQRPSIDIFDDASLTPSLEEKGRGVYFWDKADSGAGNRYIVIDDKVYKGSTASVAIHTFAAGGTDKVYFVEMVNWLVILDPENNKGYYILNSADTTVVEIIDVEFPPNKTPALQLTAGGAFLDGRLYVGTTNAQIHNSAANTPVDWDGQFLSAEREADGGVYLDKHLDHIVFFGTRTIEFFYNVPNEPPLSPLSRRTDIFHNTGLMQGDAAWREGDDIYFVGVYPSGPLEVLRLSQFQLENISTPEVESFITNARLVEDSNFVSSGFSSGKRTFYILTFYRLIGGVITPDITLVFDGISWGLWESTLEDIVKFPLIGWTIRSGSSAKSGEGMMSNGDLVTVTDNFIPVDTILSSAYIEDDYIQSGYYIANGGSGENVAMTVRTGTFDGDTNKWKFGHTLEVVGDETNAPLNAQVSWADGNSMTFGSSRDIDLSKKQKLTRLGRFKRRNHQVVIDINEQERIEAIELEYTEGGH